MTAPTETTITFRKAVNLGGIEYTSLTIREPTAGQWEGVDQLEGVAADLRAVSIIGGMPEPAVGMLGVRDFRAAVAALGSYFEESGLPADAGEHDGTATIPLRVPVTLGDESVSELKLREPTAAEWRTWDGLMATAADIKAVATITGLREVLVRQIGIRDVRAAAKWIGGFFGDALATGARS